MARLGKKFQIDFLKLYLEHSYQYVSILKQKPKKGKKYVNRAGIKPGSSCLTHDHFIHYAFDSLAETKSKNIYSGRIAVKA